MADGWFGWRVAATAAMLLASPSCSEARPSGPALSPAEKRVVREATDLVFGSGKTAEPLLSLPKAGTGGGGGGNSFPPCPASLLSRDNYDDRPEPLLPGEGLLNVHCSDDLPLDANVLPPAERMGWNMSVQLVSDLSRPPPLLHPAKRYMRGYFARSGRHCQLWLARNGQGQIDFAALRIAAKGETLFSNADHRQQECFVRGNLVALAMQGASELPFERLAYRKPLLQRSSGFELYRMNNSIRRVVANLMELTIACAAEPGSERLTRRPFTRAEFIEALSTCPSLASETVKFGMIWKREQYVREGKGKYQKPTAPEYIETCDPREC